MNRRSGRWLTVIAATVMLGWVSVPAHTAASGPVGIVADYQPVRARLVIRRAGEARPVALTIGTQIHAGDTVEQLPADGFVMVTDARGATTRIVGPGVQLPLAPRDGASLGVFARMLDSLQGYFGEPYRASRMAASQGADDCAGAGSIEVPLLPDGARVVAGTRDLRFAWKGGCGPFTVVVRDARDRELARQATTSRAARFRELALVPGGAQVEIAGGGQRHRISVEVVGALPAFPPEIAAESGADGGLVTLARAHWLAGQDGGRWKFESFDLLAPMIRAQDLLAGKYGDVLLWGVGGAPP